MTTVTIGSGLGGWAAIAAQPTYGANIVTPTRALYGLKKGTATWDPHFVQGTDYLVGGRTVDIGSARVPVYLDAKGTISGDFLNSGMALLLASAFGSNGTLTQFGTTSAYRLGGASGISYSTPDGNANNSAVSGSWFDMQFAVPDNDTGTVHPYTFHSCVITKAVWTFDRTGLVQWEYDFDAAYVDNAVTALISTPTFPTGLVPFAMQGTAPFLKIGTFGSESQVNLVRKCVITLERKMDVGRIGLGQQYKVQPVTNGYSQISVAIDADFTSTNKTAIYDNFLTNTPFSVIVQSVGNAIGTSGLSDLLQFNPSDCYIQTGGEPNLEGPDLVKSTLQLVGRIDGSNHNPLTAALNTSDSTF